MDPAIFAGQVGNFRSPFVSKTATYTATASDEVIFVDATAGAVTINLPTAVGISGKAYYIKKTDASINAVTVDASGTETIDGALTMTTITRFVSWTLVSDGANWGIL